MVAQVTISSQSGGSGSSFNSKDALNGSRSFQGGDNISTGLSASQYQQLISLLNQTSQSQVSQNLSKPPQAGISHFCFYMTSICLVSWHLMIGLWILEPKTTYLLS